MSGPTGEGGAGRGVAALAVILLFVAGGVSAVRPPAVTPDAPTSTASSPELYYVNFTAHLPSASSWTVKLGSQSKSAQVGLISFSEPNGTYDWSITGPPGYNATPPTGSVTVNGADTIIGPVAWTLYLFNVTFGETGLPKGVTWHVFLNSSNLIANASSPILFRFPNGTFPFSVGADVAWTPDPQNGQVVIHGAAVFVNVTFTPPAARYNVTFNETGLIPSTVWTYTLEGVVHEAVGGTAVEEEFSNGSYPFTVSPTVVGGYLPHPGSGTVVVDGSNVTQTIAFTPPENFSVTVRETGLPTGSWHVAVSSVPQNGSAPAGNPIVFHLENGSYTFVAAADDPGWEAHQTTGSFVVAGTNVTAPIVTFVGTAALWVVEFVPYGIGTATWWVAIGNSTWNRTGEGALTVDLANGTYAWAAGASGGLFPHPPGGTATVTGNGLVINISFSGGAASTKPSGILANYGTAILIGGLVVVALGVLGIWMMRRRGGRAPAPPDPGASGGTP